MCFSSVSWKIGFWLFSMNNKFVSWVSKKMNFNEQPNMGYLFSTNGMSEGWITVQVIHAEHIFSNKINPIRTSPEPRLPIYSFNKFIHMVLLKSYNNRIIKLLRILMAESSDWNILFWCLTTWYVTVPSPVLWCHEKVIIISPISMYYILESCPPYPLIDNVFCILLSS